MGKPVMVDHKGQQVGFCCKSCLGDFDKEPAKYLAKLPSK
jgi:YHS domain-containing protein